MLAAIPAEFRPLVESRLPVGVTPAWYRGGRPAESLGTDAHLVAADAEVAWIDLRTREKIAQYIAVAHRLRWVSMHSAGVERFPFDLMTGRDYVMTNGAGLSAIPIAEFIVMSMLSCEKNLPEVIRSHDRREWVAVAGTGELYGKRVLILGYGGIGRATAQRLRPFGVTVTGVRRNPAGETGVVGVDQWREELPRTDWLVVCAASMPASRHLVGRREIGMLKPGARLVNVARGSLVDQLALTEALDSGRVAGAYLDVTDPEPAGPAEPIWTARNVVVTSHLSGRATERYFERAADLFLANLDRYLAGKALLNTVVQSEWIRASTARG